MINEPIFQILMDTIPNPIVITDGSEMIKCNEEFISFFNYVDLEHFKEHHKCVCDLFMKESEYFSIDLISNNVLWTDYLYSHKHDEHVVSILNKAGVPRVFNITINQIEENKSQYIIVFTDITAMQNEKKLLEQMAYNDPLTGIYNRQMFHKNLLKEKENKKRHGDHLSLIMLDIDHFKEVNDTYGHEIGDKVLIALTQLISQNLRATDLFARWGGEEFMILLPRTTLDVAYHKAQELRQLIDTYVDKLLPHFTVSFGVTEILDEDEKQSAFIRVDKALYSAKEKRNDVVKI